MAFKLLIKTRSLGMLNRKNITIRDIARMAGVSAGTVDRVLHKRGRVSDESLQKVNKVLEEIDYKPNLIARSLGTNKTYRIAALIPSPNQDPYWAQSRAGIRQAEAEWSHYNVEIEVHVFDQYNKNSLKEAAESVLNAKPDGILIAPIFYHQVLPFFELYENNNIPYVLFNTNIPEVKPLSFIGQNLYQSGRLGAELMSLGCRTAGKLVVFHINEDIHNSVHLSEKERGFKEFLGEHLSFEIMTHNLRNSSDPSFENQLSEIFDDPELRGVYITTSKGCVIVASFLQKINKTDLVVVGYDMLEENLKFVQSGIVDFIINQSPKRQAFIGMNYLADYLVFQKQMPPMNLLPLEIITRENLQSYLDSRIH